MQREGRKERLGWRGAAVRCGAVHQLIFESEENKIAVTHDRWAEAYLLGPTTV